MKHGYSFIFCNRFTILFLTIKHKYLRDTQRKKRTLIIDKNDFTRKQTTKTTEQRRCARHSLHKIRMLTVTADDLVSIKNKNSHDVRPEKYETNQIKHQMKKDAKQQIVPLNISIVAICSHKVTDEKAVQ